MELTELFKKFSLETIEDKTNIPKEKLEDLQNKEWSKFKRAQALGFLNILEREFGLTLEDEKNECKSFFAEQAPKHTSASIDFVESQIANSSNGGVVSKIIAVVTVLALGYAGWYYYNKQSVSYPQQTTLDLNDTKTDNNSDKKEQKENITTTEQTNQEKQKNTKELENKNNQIANSEKVENKQEIQPKEENKQKFNISANDTKLNLDTNNNAKVEKNNTNSEKTSVKAEVDSLLNEANKSEKEQNNSHLKNKDSNKTKLLNTKDLNSSNNTNINLDDKNKSKENSLIDELDKEDNTTTQEAKLPDNIRIVVNSKKLWLGIYNLKTEKKISKIIRRGTTLDLTNGKLAIITGHGRFSLVIDNETKKFRKKGKMYLLISKEDGIKELTRKEYKELTKRKAY